MTETEQQKIAIRKLQASHLEAEAYFLEAKAKAKLIAAELARAGHSPQPRSVDCW